MTERVLDGTGRMCDGCPQDGDPKFKEGCEGLRNKISCFVNFLNDRELIFIPDAMFAEKLVEELHTTLNKAKPR